MIIKFFLKYLKKYLKKLKKKLKKMIKCGLRLTVKLDNYLKYRTLRRESFTQSMKILALIDLPLALNAAVLHGALWAVT